MNTKEKPNRYEIVAGPNKDVLFDACKYAYSKHAHVAVVFVVATGYTRMQISDIVICGIEHEDGSGESFNLHGYCKANMGSPGTTNAVRFESYYSTKTRKGLITFIE